MKLVVLEPHCVGSHERSSHGARPLAPRRPAHPEILPERCAWDDADELHARLASLTASLPWVDGELGHLSWDSLLGVYRAEIEALDVNHRRHGDR